MSWTVIAAAVVAALFVIGVIIDTYEKFRNDD